MKRIQADIPFAIFEILKSLKRRTLASSYSEVIRKSLRLYRWYVSVKETKGCIQVVQEDGTIRDVETIL